METATLSFPYSSRDTYYAVRDFVKKKCTQFLGVKCNDELYIVEARRGAWLSPFSEQVKIKVVATGQDSCKVVVESTSRSMLNILNFGANSTNVSDLSDYINNAVHNRVRIVPNREDDGIRLRKPDIRFTGGYKPHDD